MNVLHFAVVLFVVSWALIAVVSLATEPDGLIKLRGLTFKTLEGDDIAPAARSQSLFHLHLGSSVTLAATVIMLWIYVA